ncbi:MAG: YggU family protein [Gemmatimonadetes bacterium]|nr:YggU family protein [Gemmatimonadota bacterium]
MTPREGAVRFAVRVQPRASRAGVDGVHGDALRVRVHAPPVDGAANDAVIAVLADALRVAKRDVRIVSGEGSRSKVVEVAGVSVEAVRALAG